MRFGVGEALEISTDPREQLLADIHKNCMHRVRSQRWRASEARGRVSARQTVDRT